jgi:hypothetical protein
MNRRTFPPPGWNREDDGARVPSECANRKQNVLKQAHLTYLIPILLRGDPIRHGFHRIL